MADLLLAAAPLSRRQHSRTMEERIEMSTTICHQRHRPLRRTRAVIGLLLLTTTTNNSSYNSASSGLAVAFTTPLHAVA